MPLKGSGLGRRFSKLSRIDREQLERFVAQIEKEKSFLETVIHHLTEGVVVIDENGKLLFLNSVARELLRLNPNKKCVGESLVNILSHSRVREFVERINPLSRESLNEELRESPPRRRILHATVIPLLSKQDEVSGQILILRDVTQSRLRDAAQAHADRLASLATLTAGVAHEIKNPLNSLNIHAQLLQRTLKNKGQYGGKIDSARLEQSADVILEEIQRLSHIVDQFLQAARPTRPQLELKNPNRLIERSVETIRPEFEEKSVEVKLILDPDVPETLLDERQIHQALINILRNAFEAIQERMKNQEEKGIVSEPGRITLESRITDSNVPIAVSDNGCGISPESFNRIFEPYYSTKFSGTGLGLMIIHRIVHEHGGTVNLQSTVGEGTRVAFTIPLTQKPVRLITEN
ncbi:MAG: ATP-binding protein [bacterium]